MTVLEVELSCQRRRIKIPTAVNRLTYLHSGFFPLWKGRQTWKSYKKKMISWFTYVSYTHGLQADIWLTQFSRNKWTAIKQACSLSWTLWLCVHRARRQTFIFMPRCTLFHPSTNHQTIWNLHEGKTLPLIEMSLSKLHQVRNDCAI